jgi:hypothetical protein
VGGIRNRPDRPHQRAYRKIISLGHCEQAAAPKTHKAGCALEKRSRPLCRAGQRSIAQADLVRQCWLGLQSKSTATKLLRVRIGLTNLGPGPASQAHRGFDMLARLAISGLGLP